MTLVLLAILGAFAFILLVKLLWGNRKLKINSTVVLVSAGVLALVLLLVTLMGKFHPLAALGTMVFPFLRRVLGLVAFAPNWFYFWQRRKQQHSFGFGDPKPGDTTTSTQTQDLSMTLDHETGNISGTVLTGEYAQKNLEEMSDHEISRFYNQLSNKESKDLLGAYIARHRDHLMQAEDQAPASPQGSMTRQRAADILGINTAATRDEIIAAHRRLIQRLHPDQGGSSYLAAELNEAKKVLLDNR